MVDSLRVCVSFGLPWQWQGVFFQVGLSSTNVVSDSFARVVMSVMERGSGRSAHRNKCCGGGVSLYGPSCKFAGFWCFSPNRFICKGSGGFVRGQVLVSRHGSGKSLR